MLGPILKVLIFSLFLMMFSLIISVWPIVLEITMAIMTGLFLTIIVILSLD